VIKGVARMAIIWAIAVPVTIVTTFEVKLGEVIDL
jgi:hypothetical protein